MNGPHWWKRTAKAALAIAVVLLLSGAAGTFYFRPRGHDVRVWLAAGHVRYHLTAVGALHAVHQLGAYLLIACGLALAVGWGLERRRARQQPLPSAKKPIGLAAGLAVLSLVFLASGHLVPWQRLLPWSPGVGSNLGRPVAMVGHDGPFPE